MATDTPMQLGMVGLGRMGAGIVRRLLEDGHHCVGYDIHPDAVEALVADGAEGPRRSTSSREARDSPGRCGSWCPAGEITTKTIEAVPTCSSPATS